MIERISRSFSTYSSKQFLVTKERAFTYSEAALISDNIAFSLTSEIELNQGDIAVVQMNNSIEFILFILSLWRIGVVPVPLNPNLNEKETTDLISFINPRLVIRKDELSLVENSSIKAVNQEELNGNDKAVIIFTSGTSGKPKGVVLNYNNVFGSFDNGNSVLNFNENDKWLASLPFYHIGGFSIIIRTILSGARLIIPSSTKTEDIVASLLEFNPTILSLVSTQFKRLLDLEITPNAALKNVLLGGGFIDDKLLYDGINKGWPISKVYGSSETSSFFTYIYCNNDIENLSSSGKPLKDNLIEIRDDDNKVLSPGEIGNVWLKGISCSSEYYRNEQETELKFVNGWYNSGDFGSIDIEGYLHLSARRSDLIITGGENVNPYEIENTLKELDQISDAVVFGEEDKEWGHIVSAAVITKDSDFANESELKNGLREKISAHKIPKKFYFMKEFPRNELGKINKEYLKNILMTTRINKN